MVKLLKTFINDIFLCTFHLFFYLNIRTVFKEHCPRFQLCNHSVKMTLYQMEGLDRRIWENNHVLLSNPSTCSLLSPIISQSQGATLLTSINSLWNQPRSPTCCWVLALLLQNLYHIPK